MKLKIAALALSLAALAVPASAHSGIKIGVLSCHIDGGYGYIIGSNRGVSCVFHRTSGGVERYSGSIGRLGVDIGKTYDASLSWAVFAPGKLNRGALKGHYIGAGAEATVGAGVGANALVGGFKKGINLQPLSLQAQSGLNVAAGVESLTLHAH